jgi:hypothetical protein
MRRGRPVAVDATLTHDAAAWLEAYLGPGVELVHTRRMGWMLREWATYTNYLGQPADGWREVDSAPEGQLAALLLRHQRGRQASPD